MELGRIISETSGKIHFLAVVDIWFLLTSQQVMLCRMMFSKVISIVALTFLPTHLYLILYFSVAQPMIAHIPGFGAFLLHVIMYETISSRVVGFKWCWWLGMWLRETRECRIGRAC